jgi:hypothetical protein
MDQPAPAAPTVPASQAGAPTQVLTPTPTPTPPQPVPSFGVPPVGAPVSFGAPPGATLPRRGLPVWAIILLAVGGLCAIGCVASLAVVGIFGNSAASATATPKPSGLGGGIVPIPTRQGDAPPTEAPVATEEIPAPTAADIPTAEPTSSGGGIVGGVNAGGAAQIATAEAATAQVVAATAEIEQANAELATLLASGKQIFQDEFVDNRNNWFTGTFNDIETDKIEDGVFKVIWAGDSTSYELYEVREMTNFVAEVDCLVHQGGTDGSCGLVFSQKKKVGYYKFEVFDNYYRLFVVHPEGDPTTLAEGDPVGIVKPGDVNRLRVIKQGDQISIFLNGTPLKTLSDSTYTTGKVGVSTDSYKKDGGVEIWFDNFVIWELPA